MMTSIAWAVCAGNMHSMHPCGQHVAISISLSLSLSFFLSLSLSLSLSLALSLSLSLSFSFYKSFRHKTQKASSSAFQLGMLSSASAACISHWPYQRALEYTQALCRGDIANWPWNKCLRLVSGSVPSCWCTRYAKRNRDKGNSDPAASNTLPGIAHAWLRRKSSC